MSAVAPIIRLLPVILRLFGPVRTGTIARGRVVPLNSISESTDADLQRLLKLKTRIRPREDFKDSSHVIKISDVVTIVEESFNETSLAKEFVLAAAAEFISGTFGGQQPPRAGGQKIADRIIERCREETLRQDTARIGSKVVLYPRPARGHGGGRESVDTETKSVSSVTNGTKKRKSDKATDAKNQKRRKAHRTRT